MPSPSGKSDFEFHLIESFSKHVRTYDRHAQLQRAMAERLAALLPDPLPGRLLEIGCGTGLFTRHLLARGVRNLVLNDLAPAMVEHLRRHLTLPAHTRVQVGNAETLTFPKVDLIAANAVFQWFLNPASTLKRLARSLGARGMLVFSAFGPRTLEEFREAGSFQGPVALMSSTDWKRHLTQAGFGNLRCETEERQIFFNGTRDLLKNLQQIGAAPLRLMKPAGLKRLIRDYDHKYRTAQGVYTHWELLYFSAQRRSK